MVCGGSGFIGAHCILQLLAAGYRTRTTVRSLQREAGVRAMLQVGGAEPTAQDLSFTPADLMFDSSVGQIVPELGKFKNATNQKARRLLGWAPRSNEDSIIATAESLVRFGLLRNSRNTA